MTEARTFEACHTESDIEAHGYSSKREPLHTCNPPVVLRSLN